MCGVITQHRQFSFYRKSNAPTPRDEIAWDKAQKLATEIINDPTILPYSTADHYHTPAVLYGRIVGSFIISVANFCALSQAISSLGVGALLFR